MIPSDAGEFGLDGRRVVRFASRVGRPRPLPGRTRSDAPGRGLRSRDGIFGASDVAFEPGPTAVLDTDVLVPVAACDFLLTAFDHGLYEPIVSTAALAEIERTLIEDFPHLNPDGI